MADLMPVKEFERIYRLIRGGKKVVCVDRILKHTEDFNPRDAEGKFPEGWGTDKLKHTAVVYLYTNPQQNRMFAHLEDGRDVDFDLSFMNIMWKRFEEYDPPVKPESWRDIFDASKKRYGHQSEAHKAAYETEYPYYVWNELIYRTKDDLRICTVSEV